MMQTINVGHDIYLVCLNNATDDFWHSSLPKICLGTTREQQVLLDLTADAKGVGVVSLPYDLPYDLPLIDSARVADMLTLVQLLA